MTTVRFYVQTSLEFQAFPWGHVIAEKQMTEVPMKGDIVVLHNVWCSKNISQTLYGEVIKRQFDGDIVNIALDQLQGGHYAFKKQ